MKRQPNSNTTLIIYIAIFIWSLGGYLVVKDYLKNGVLNGPMVLLLIPGILLTTLAIFHPRKK